MNNKNSIMLSIATAMFLVLISSFAVATIDLVTLNSPADLSLTNNRTPAFNFTVIGNFSAYNCTLFLNLIAMGNKTAVLNDTSTIITANASLSDAAYSWHVNCTDSDGTVGVAPRTLTVDTALTVSLSTGTNASGNYSQSYIFANVTSSDANLDTIVLTLYSSTGLVQTNISTTSPLAILFAPLSDGVYYLNASANDSAGNTNTTTTRVIRLDTMNPITAITSPVVEGNVSTAAVTVGLTVNDAAINYTNISLWNAAGIMINSTLNFSNGTIANTLYSSDGVINVTATSVDMAGNSATATMITGVTVDTVNPVVTIGGSSTAAGNSVTGTITVNVSVTELHLADVTIFVFNATGGRYANYSNTTGMLHTFTSVPEGNYSYYVNATDTFAHKGASTPVNSIVIDQTGPTITVESPTSNYHYNTTTIIINFTATDTEGVSELWYYNGTGNTTATADEAQTLTLAEGAYTYILSANDTLGNIASVTRTFTVDTTYPTVTISSPANQTNVSTAAVSITINVTETNINYTNISIKRGTLINSTLNSSTGTFTVILYSSDGLINVTATSVDLAGHSTTATATTGITVDTTNPVVGLRGLNTSSRVSTINWIHTNFTATDTNLASLTTYLFTGTTLYNSTTTSGSSPLNIWSNFTGLPDGNYSYYANGTDTFGHTGSSSTINSIVVDNTAPSMTLNITNGSYVSATNLTISFTVSDSITVQNCFVLVDSVNVTAMNNTNCSANQFTITDLTEAVHNISISANDTLDNAMFATYYFTIDRTVPVMSSPLPSGEKTSSTTSVTLSITTNENASCKYDTSNVSYASMGTNFTNSGTAHTKSYAVSSGNSYTIYTRCMDTAGNTDTSSAKISFSVAAAATSSSSSSGGGTTTTTNTLTDSASLIYSLVSAGTKSIDVSNMLLTGIDLTTTTSARDVRFVITASNTAPVAYTDGKVYKYISIEHQNLDNAIISSAVVSFKVEKSWLTANGYTKYDIQLMRQNNGWNKLITIPQTEDTTYVFYEAQTSGLSIFAISAKKSVAAETTNTTTTNQTTNATITPVTTTQNGTGNKTTTTTTTTTSSGPNAWIIILIIVIVVLAIILFTLSQRRKQNKDDEVTAKDIEKGFKKELKAEVKQELKEAKEEDVVKKKKR